MARKLIEEGERGERVGVKGEGGGEKKKMSRH